MKKFFVRLLKALPLVAAFSVVAYFAACSNSSASLPVYYPGAGENYFAQGSLAHRAYTGGSLIYNPSNSSLSQLWVGARVAVRASSLEKSSRSLYQVADDTSEITVAEDGTYAGSKSENFDLYLEKQGSESFGFITVTSIGANSINFTYSYYPSASSALVVESHKLLVGESEKVAGGKASIKYGTPQIARRGFENARWLTFINSKESLSACMYSCMPEANNSTPSSLYGVNSHNDFIYIVGNPQDSKSYYTTTAPTYNSDMITYGDYIVNQGESSMSAFVGDGSTSVVSSNIRTEADFNGSENFVYYAYRKYQFPDPVNGPRHLFESLPPNVQASANQALSGLSLSDESELYVKKLNWVLCSKDALTSIARNFAGKSESVSQIGDLFGDSTFYSDEVASSLNAWANKIESGNSTAEAFENANKSYVETMRNFMDGLYENSPDASVAPPTLFNIWPDIALDIGNSQAKNASGVSASRAWDAEAVKSIGNVKDYNSYVAKRKEIEDKFGEFHSISLAKVNDTKLSNIPLLNVKFAFGVKGKVVCNLGISGEFGIKGLGAAVFAQVEASTQNLELGDHSLRGLLPKKIQDAMHDDAFSVSFSIGPVPCVFKTKYDLDFGWNAAVKTDAKYFAGLTALYGGSIDLGASWGVKFKWKIIPVGGYFNTWPKNSQSITENALFVGPCEGAPDVNAGLDLGIWVRGTVTPQVGVGFKYLSLGVEAPCSVQPEIHFITDTKFINPPDNTPYHLKGILGIKITFDPYFEVVIPIIKKSLKTHWTAATLLDWKKELFDEPLPKEMVGSPIAL